MDKYWEQDMKSLSNCSNAGELNIDLPNLFSSKLCLSPSNDHIINLKDYRDFAEENKQYDSSDCQHDGFQPNDVTSWSELEKEDSSHLFIKLILMRYRSSIRTSRG